MKLREYLKLPYTIVLKRDEEGDFIARVKEFDGCVADGQDEMDALGNLSIVKELWLETALKAGQQIPLPENEPELPSGKFLIRVPRTLHKSLVDLAREEDVSLNQLVTVSLAETVGRKSKVLHAVHGGEYVPNRKGETSYATNTASKLRLVLSSAPDTPGDAPVRQEVVEALVDQQRVQYHTGTWGHR